MLAHRSKRRSKKRSKKWKKKSAIDKLNRPGLTEAMRNVSFKLDIQVTETARSGFNKESVDSIDAGPITQCVFDERRGAREAEASAEERNRVGFIGNAITLENTTYTRDGRLASMTRHTYKSKKNKNYLTIEELVDIIVRFERLDRPKSSIINDGRIDREFVVFYKLKLLRDNTSYKVCLD